MGEPTYVNVLIKTTESNPPTPTRGTGTIAIIGYTPRVDAGFVGDEINISATGAMELATAGDTLDRTTGSWINDGIEVGDIVRISDAAAPTDNGDYTVTAVTTTVLSFAENVAVGESGLTKANVEIFDASTVDNNDPPAAGEVKSFTNLFDIRTRYGNVAAITRSAEEAIANNCSMPIVLMPIAATDTTYARGSTDTGETYDGSTTPVTSLVLTNTPTLPVTVYEGNDPLIEGFDASTADFWVDVSNKTVYFHKARTTTGNIWYRSIQVSNITDHISNLEGKVVNFVVGSYMMGQTLLQDEIFNHILATEAGTKKRMGIVANAKDSTSVTIATNYLNDRMIAYAHKSKTDICAIAAAVLSRINPWTSQTLKLAVRDYSDDNFSDAEYDAFKSAQINALVNSEFVFGENYRFTESFTLSSNSFKKYIDAVRVIDDSSFKVRARLSNPSLIGTVKLGTVAGMNSLRATVTSLMNAMVAIGEIDNYSFIIPGEEIVRKSPGERTAEEDATLATMISSRTFKIVIDITYTGAVHYLDPVELKFSAT